VVPLLTKLGDFEIELVGDTERELWDDWWEEQEQMRLTGHVALNSAFRFGLSFTTVLLATEGREANEELTSLG